MIKYSKEYEKDLNTLTLTEQEKETIKGVGLGTLPPYNLGRDDIILLQRLESRHYELYFTKEHKTERITNVSVRNYLANLGFNKRYFNDIHILMMKKVFEPGEPKWRLKDNIWFYNEYDASEWSILYQYYRDYHKQKKIKINSTTELILPPLHAELFNNVFNDKLSIEYMAIKIKRLLSGVAKSNTYTILRGIGGTGKSLFLHYLSNLIGINQSRTLNHKDLLSSFNGPLYRGVVLTIEEFPTNNGECNSMLRLLKEYVANERITIRRKFMENLTTKNYTNFFITTNYFDLYETMGERRHCEVVSRDIKLIDLPLFKQLDAKQMDFIEALLYEAPLFFKALIEWKCTRFNFNSKFISPTIINYKQVRSQSDFRVKQLIEALLNHDYEAVLSYNNLEINTLTLLPHYNKKTKKFAIPYEVAKEHYMLIDNLELLLDNKIIIE